MSTTTTRFDDGRLDDRRLDDRRRDHTRFDLAAALIRTRSQARWQIDLFDAAPVAPVAPGASGAPVDGPAAGRETISPRGAYQDALYGRALILDLRDADRFAAQAADKAVDRTVDEAVDRTADEAVDQGADRSGDQGADRSGARSGDRSGDRGDGVPARAPGRIGGGLALVVRPGVDLAALSGYRALHLLVDAADEGEIVEPAQLAAFAPGRPQVRVISGGFEAWRRAGLPVHA